MCNNIENLKIRFENIVLLIFVFTKTLIFMYEYQIVEIIVDLFYTEINLSIVSARKM